MSPITVVPLHETEMCKFLRESYFWCNYLQTAIVTQQVSNCGVDMSHVLRQQRRPVCPAVVLHQSLKQQQLPPANASLGEPGLLVRAVATSGRTPQTLT